ncbi:ABC transporter ATP-binding protein [Tuberibacillus sp. Marseille-P3662]|uniref:ABC transporter ATP-binding protein n=1 Tax=Tuberibacillus sp. Marseille-P3662 TaxID=1965358 RepID=UPI000A1CC948|nr:ABC transporter ATP-binding protein [Tuberibacillus sp. Marseille-P3662]
MTKPIIQLDRMMKSYQLGDDHVLALNDVSLKVYQGAFLSVIGPSGSGKSTFMNMIGCLDRPDSGRYLLDDEEVAQMNDNQLADIRNKKIGFIFQNFNLLGKFTALENVALPLSYRAISTKERRELAFSCLEQVGLSERANHLPNQLSGGQQQRVAIARALVGQPPILLADEPTGALDSETSHEVLDTMKQLHQDGHTIILISHDMDVAKAASKRIQIKDGQLYHERR